MVPKELVEDLFELRCLRTKSQTKTSFGPILWVVLWCRWTDLTHVERRLRFEFHPDLLNDNKCHHGVTD